MGIPRLTTTLEPYANRKTLAGRDIIIDGPAFCHHIYYLSLKATPTARNGLEASPSYRVLVRTALAWLDEIRKTGAVIKRIYFDGSLPSAKFDTRLERLNRSTIQAVRFYNQNQSPCRAHYPVAEDALLDLFVRGSPRFPTTTLPPLPFLVPAILESLVQSAEYKEITQVVPGEADLYCAHHVAEHGGVVLTSDSDLLVHELGQDGAVSFLKDVRSISVPETSSGQLDSLLYESKCIAERLELSPTHGIRSLAFELLQDPYLTFPQLAKNAKACKSLSEHPEEFSQFLGEYDLSLPKMLDASDKNLEVCSQLRILDPRISELVLYFVAFTSTRTFESVSESIRLQSPHIFLPFLHDCPVRTSAWECTTALRQLAYGLLNLTASRDRKHLSVFEHRRQTDKSNGRELQLPDQLCIPEECVNLIGQLSALRARFPELTKEELWIAMALHQNVESFNVHDKSPTVISFMRQFSQLQASNSQGSFTWEAVHFFAELQASLYSFRILQQILCFVLVHNNSFPEALGRLHTELRSLPELTQYPSLVDAASAIRKVSDSRPMLAIKCIQEKLLPSSIASSWEGARAEADVKSRKKRKRDRRQSDLSVDAKKIPANLFELLDVE